MRLLPTLACIAFAGALSGAAQADPATTDTAPAAPPPAEMTAPANAPMVMDAPITINGIETVCTGIGDSKDDPRWAAYPIRAEFSNGGAQYLSGAHVTLSSAGHAPLAEFDCHGAWVLFKLAHGSYTVTASIEGSSAKPRSATFQPPATGQKRVVLQFPDFQPNQ
jgi:hypothetical protein